MPVMFNTAEQHRLPQQNNHHQHHRLQHNQQQQKAQQVQQHAERGASLQQGAHRGRAHHAEEPCQQEWERVTRELEQAFSDIGCAYLTGHGVPDHLINEMLSTGVAFFKQQEEVKIRWAKDTNIHGYIKMNSERFAGAGPELHEGFVFNPACYGPYNEEVPLFMTLLVPLHEFCRTLSRRLMTCFALSVGKNRDYFVNMHQDSGTKNSLSSYRLNYYPLASGDQEDVVGFGAHTDYTTITLLFSNNSKGLQVQHLNVGRFVTQLGSGWTCPTFPAPYCYWRGSSSTSTPTRGSKHRCIASLCPVNTSPGDYIVSRVAFSIILTRTSQCGLPVKTLPALLRRMSKTTLLAIDA
ncbi:hypothetical protein O3P69_004138 [Scylla paramamosain]|uniref:Uncharacterized protein n=1 Tax=Scylla paramamosain TaxID=85552 RepID=A0AAW0UFB1_SCYPA